MTRATSFAVLLCAALAGIGCLGPIPDRSRFFTLATPPPLVLDGAEAPRGPALPAGTVYGLGPVVLPAYLDRNQIAIRVSPTEVSYAQWDRWAEPLAVNVSSVLRQTLAGRLGTDAIVEYPWPVSTRIDYQLEVRLLRFEADAAGETHLVAQWSITDVRNTRRLVTKQTSLARSGQAGDTAGGAAALSGMLNELGVEIADALRTSGAAKGG